MHASYDERNNCTSVMMRGHIVRRLCVGRNRETNKNLDDSQVFLMPQFLFVLVLLVSYLSEQFRAHLESFGPNIGKSYYLGR